MRVWISAILKVEVRGMYKDALSALSVCVSKLSPIILLTEFEAK